jgi:1-acyl-sn-glycerol-3-phosphate acyltransferase
MADRRTRRRLLETLARRRPLFVRGVPSDAPGLLLTADHPGYLDGPLLALLVARPLLFAVDSDFARGVLWCPLLIAHARLTGHDFVALSPHAPCALRVLARRLEGGGAVCLFPEGGIRRGGPARPWRPGAAWLARRANVWQHVTIEGTDRGLFATHALRFVFAPPRTGTALSSDAVQPDEGNGRVPSSSRSKSSTATISSTRS